MINYYISNIRKIFFLLTLRFSFKKKIYQNFKDLNFKQNDFTNYKIIKHYILKENFTNNIMILDIHSFNFLLFFKKIGGKKGINLSKKNIFEWFKKYKYYKGFPWVNDFSSKRFINILYSYDFICSTSNEKEIKHLNLILNFHVHRIMFDIKRKKIEDISSFDILAFVLIEFINKNFNKHSYINIIEIINSQIDENAMHKSYNILEHSKFINNLNEVKNILLFFKFDSSELLNNKILAMTSLLNTYKHNDLSLPLFNGCNNNHNKEIKKIFEKEQFLKNVTLKNFNNGIALYRDQNKTIFFDVVQPTKYGFNKDLFAGSLALEISGAGEKIITNCGGTEAGGKNPGYLKYSAAHSTIVINNTNVSEIKEGEINKTFPKQVIFETKDSDKSMILSGSHNGYLKNYRKICKRELIINKKKNLIEGKDTIISTRSNIEKTVYHIRFHLMPETSTTMTKNMKSVIIKTENNNIWMFKSDNEIMIKKSIYVRNDIAIETSQIVISGITSLLKNKIKWSLEKI